MEIEIKVRDYDPSNDLNYILLSWAKYDFYSKHKKTIKNPKEKQKWFIEKKREINELLESCMVKVACIKGSEYVIAGYSVSEPLSPHSVIWMCIKKDYQKQGIEQLLLKSIERGQNERA